MPSEKALRATRILIFVDYWNLQLTINERVQRATGATDPRFRIDWLKLPNWIIQQVSQIATLDAYSYEGTRLYCSYNPANPGDRKFHGWLTTWLNRQPGIQVVVKERRPKRAPKCSECHRLIPDCPHCQMPIKGTVEKGVDTAIATDMIRFAWEEAYDIAVLASSDADLVPVVQFLDQKGLRVVQAGFPPAGVDLATNCWASFNVFAGHEEFERKW